MSILKIINDEHQEFEIILNGVFQNVKDFLCSDGQYVRGDGVHDDTTGIQNAFDNAKGEVYFPSGTYKVSGTGEYCLLLSRNINLRGVSTRWVTIRADNTPPETSVLKVAITDNFGLMDVRNWEMKNLTIFNNGGGKHAVIVKDGMQISTSLIENNNLHGNIANGGDGLCIIDNISHSEINLNTLSTIYAKCFDANLFRKNNIFGEGVGITLDCELGVYNNTIESNTITNKNGGIKVVNGDAIRIKNNQFEQNQIFGENTSSPSSMVTILGTDRKCNNIVISENNLGGGTNVDNLIYIDNATMTVIEKNQMKASDAFDIIFTENSSYNYLEKTNTIIGNADDLRENNVIKVLDNGFNNFGVVPYEEPIPQNPVITTIVNDDFNRPNQDYLGTALTGQMWQTISNNFKISNNEAKLKTTSQDLAFIETLKSDVTITCIFGNLSSLFARNIKVVFRYIDQNNYFWITPFDISGMTYSLYKRINGVDILIHGTTLPFITGDELKIEVNGVSIKAYKNSEEWVDVVCNDLLFATKHGLYLYSEYDSFNSFKIESLL